MNYFLGGFFCEIGNISVFELLDVYNNYLIGDIFFELGEFVNFE